MRQTRMTNRWFDGQWKTDDRQDLRRQWDHLLHLTRYLDEQERVFVEAVIERGERTVSLAQLTGRSQSSVRRQLSGIFRRLSGRELRAMVEHPAAFTPLEKKCLREHLVRRQALSRMSADLNISIYILRKTLAAARAKALRLNAK